MRTLIVGSVKWAAVESPGGWGRWFGEIQPPEGVEASARWPRHQREKRRLFSVPRPIFFGRKMNEPDAPPGRGPASEART